MKPLRLYLGRLILWLIEPAKAEQLRELDKIFETELIGGLNEPNDNGRYSSVSYPANDTSEHAA